MTILHVDSSITGDASASRELSAAIVARLRAERPDAEVVRRDLAAEPLPHLTLDALGGPDTNPALAEFLAADTVVIGSGMYNFGIPSQLKAWIDRLLIPNFTFRYGEAGPQGLVAGKRVIVAVARGGFYGPDTLYAAAEHDASYLRAVFGFIGVTDIEFAVAEGLKYNPDARDATIAAALAEVPLAA